MKVAVDQVARDQETGRGVVVVELEGEVDVYSAPEARRVLVELIERDHLDLAVDLRNVAFIDSSGLGVLVGVLRKVQPAGGSLVLICTGGQPARVLKQTQLDHVFRVQPSLEALEPPASSVV